MRNFKSLFDLYASASACNCKRTTGKIQRTYCFGWNSHKRISIRCTEYKPVTCQGAQAEVWNVLTVQDIWMATGGTLISSFTWSTSRWAREAIVTWKVETYKNKYYSSQKNRVQRAMTIYDEQQVKVMVWTLGFGAARSNMWRQHKMRSVIHMCAGASPAGEWLNTGRFEELRNTVPTVVYL